MTGMREIPAVVRYDPATGELHLKVTDPAAARMAWRVEHLTVDVEYEGRRRTDELRRAWVVGDGPDGPVEWLAPYHYMSSFLADQAHKSPRATAKDLSLAWSIRHPAPTHDTDPRGRLAVGSSEPVRLDDGTSTQFAIETRRLPDGTFTTSASIRCLPRRTLSWREFTALLEVMNRAARSVIECGLAEGEEPDPYRRGWQACAASIRAELDCGPSEHKGSQ